MHHRYVIPIMLLVAATAIAGAILFSVLRPVPAVAPSEVTTPRQETFGQMLLVGDNAIFVDDQPSGATEVFVGFAILKNGGYVEIYADDEGHPGQAIGRSELLLDGGAEHFTVTVDEPLVDHKIYYAMLINEDGTPVTDADGNVILMSFAAREDAIPETGVVLP